MLSCHSWIEDNNVFERAPHSIVLLGGEIDDKIENTTNNKSLLVTNSAQASGHL